MMQFYLLLATGILIVGFTAFDFFYTTLSFRGAGPMTKVATDCISAVFLFINRHTPNRVILSFSGLVHILILASIWIGLLWLGLFLILLSSDISVVHTFSKESANWVNKLYFSGYILSTLGNGDFIPAGELWQIVTVLFSFSGFIFISTIISYLVSLTSAVLDKRALSLFISNIGESAEDIVINTYSDGNFSRLKRLVITLQEKIDRLNQNHFAYPVSHYFTSISTEDSLSVNLFNLDEALTIIKYQIDKGPSLEGEIRPLRDAIKKFLFTIKDNFVSEIKDEQSLSPNKKRFYKLGIPLINGGDASQNNKELEERRYLLYGFLKSTGWNLDDIHLDHIKKSN